jgi:uncharacterized membrane protein
MVVMNISQYSNKSSIQQKTHSFLPSHSHSTIKMKAAVLATLSAMLSLTMATAVPAVEKRNPEPQLGGLLGNLVGNTVGGLTGGLVGGLAGGAVNGLTGGLLGPPRPYYGYPGYYY